MATVPTGGRRSATGARRGFLAVCLGLSIAGCSTATATPTATLAAAATPTATPTPAAATPTSAPTPAAPTATPTASPTRVATVAPTVAPGPLCTASELTGAVMIWHTLTTGVQGDFFTGPRTSTVGGRLCYMRGTAEGQMVSDGTVIADSGASSAGVVSSDPYLPVDAGGRIYASVVWSNWCPKGPSQPVTIAFVLPGGLGRSVVNTSGPTPVPPCVSSGSPTTVTSVHWHTTYP
ncbi:MAG: hypothetical protein ABSD62_07670 [Candidatus Limnocylindrales bacterium]|jgi:hypothetical protein